MGSVSVMGLGRMGSALARTFVTAGHEVTVWNRTPEKAQQLVCEGAQAAANAQSAVEASPVIIVCVADYDATHSFMAQGGVSNALHNRSVVQFSTGTPQEAYDSAAWFSERGCSYLDGAIMTYPSDVGTDKSLILIGGPENVFKRCTPLIDCLGGSQRYVGNNVRAAAALDLALLTYSFGIFVSVAHGARVCEAENVDVDLFGSLFEEDGWARGLAQMVHNDDYEQSGSTLSVWSAGLDKIRRQASDARMNGEFPDFVSDLFKRAIAAGYGEQDAMAIVKVLRDGA